MAAQSNTEFEQNVSCPVCLSRFDDIDKKPKYLVACCHTICKCCLHKITQSGALKRITCPICRRPTECTGGVDDLPTNGDKLYLLKLDRPLQQNEDEILQWCFTCRKKTSTKCSVDQHSVIVMNPQLLNSEIQLNMASISSQLKKHGQATIEHRREIGVRLEKISRWLSSHLQMIERLQKANQSRISQISGMIQGTDLTVSIQKLMQLSINMEPDLGVLKDGLEEEALTNKLLQELRIVEQVASVSGPGQNDICFRPSLPNLRKELDYDKYFDLEGASNDQTHHWPLIFLESLSQGPFSRFSRPRSLTNRFSVVPATNLVHLEVEQPPPISPYFRFPSASPNPHANVVQQQDGTLGVPPVFCFGRPSPMDPSPNSAALRREIISVRRRRNNLN